MAPGRASDASAYRAAFTAGALLATIHQPDKDKPDKRADEYRRQEHHAIPGIPPGVASIPTT